jgi:hypothetical protein
MVVCSGRPVDRIVAPADALSRTTAWGAPVGISRFGVSARAPICSARSERRKAGRCLSTALAEAVPAFSKATSALVVSSTKERRLQAFAQLPLDERSQANGLV